MRDLNVIPPGAPPAEGLELDVLGHISLRRDGKEVRTVLAQPKRFGLLVYLYLRRPEGFVRRDELLGIFWPEATEGRARASLRQALRFLRSRLGGGLILNRGDAEVGIAPGTVLSDVFRFLRALEAGDDGAAVDAYGGDLLPGFILSGVYDFDRWLQGERHRLRAAAVQAALRLIGDSEEAGDLGRARELARWAMSLEPTNETVGRHLISLLAETGNRAAAVAAYESLRNRLAGELGLEPSDETSELIMAVRDSDGASKTRPGLPGRTRRHISPQRVLVLGFENLTGEDHLTYLGRLAADALAQELARVPELEVVPPLAALGILNSSSDTEERRGAGAPAGPSAEVDMASQTGAGTLVSGSYHLEGDMVHFRVRITDMVAGKLLRGPEVVAAPRSAPLAAVEEVRSRVAAFVAPALTSRATHAREALRPPGIEAYRAYLEGLEYFIRGQWYPALTHFRKSVKLEEGYALPRIVSAICRWNVGELPGAEAMAAEALELSGSLGRFERAMLEMVMAWLRGDWAVAYRATRIQAGLAPGSIPHFQVAEEARRLNRPREAREVLSTLDPESGELEGWIFYWMEITAACHLMGDHRHELELASRCRSLHPNDPVAALLEVRALAALGRDTDVVRILDQAMAAPGGRDPHPGALFREAGLELAAHGHPDIAGEIFQQGVAWHEERADENASEASRRDFARSLYHAGRPEEARALFQELAMTHEGLVQPVGHHHGQLQAHLDEGYLAVMAAQEGDDRETGRWCRWLEELEGPFLYGAQWFWRAAVAVMQNEKDRAVIMLRRAFADGLPFEMFLHTDPHLLQLRGLPAFDSLMRPRG